MPVISAYGRSKGEADLTAHGGRLRPVSSAAAGQPHLTGPHARCQQADQWPHWGRDSTVVFRAVSNGLNLQYYRGAGTSPITTNSSHPCDITEHGLKGAGTVGSRAGWYETLSTPPGEDYYVLFYIYCATI